MKQTDNAGVRQVNSPSGWDKDCFRLLEVEITVFVIQFTELTM